MNRKFWCMIIESRYRNLLIIVAEALIVSICVLAYLSEKTKGVDSLDMGIRVKDFSSEYMEYDEGWYMDQDMLDTDVQPPIDLLYGPFISLPKGNYTLTIEYDCDHGQKIRPYAAGENNYYIVTNHFMLDKNLYTMSFNFRTKETIDNFEIRTYYDGEGFLRIKNIHLYRNLNGYKETIFFILLFFIVADICFFRSFLIARKKEALILAAIVFITGFNVFIKGIDYPLEDIDFHLMRIEGLSNEIRLGHIPVRIQSCWSGVSGYPVSVYYGDILLYFPAILRLIGFSVSFSYAAYLTFVNILTVLISFLSFRSIVKNTDIALLMTLGYTGCAYRYATVFENGLLGEYTAASFMPLLAAALYSIYTDENSHIRPDIRQAIILALGMSGIILSHTISAVISILAIFTFCLLNFRKTFRIRTVLSLVTAVFFTALLSLFFIIPFLDYYLNVKVLVNNVGEKVHHIQSTGINMYGILAVFQNPYITGSRATPGMLLMLSLIAGIVLWISIGVNKKIKIAIVYSLLWLWMSTYYFPWDWLAENSELANSFTGIQFLERIEVYGCLGLTVLMGLLLEYLSGMEFLQSRVRYNILMIFISGVALMGIFIFFGQYLEHKNVYYVLDGSEVPHDTKSGAEYMRVDKEGEPIDYIRKDLEAMNAQVDVLSEIGWTMDMNVHTSEGEGIIKMPYTNYKGYKAFDAEGNEFTIYDDEYCKVAFNIPPYYDGTVEVSFVEPWYWRLSEIISIVSWAVLGSYIIFERRIMVKLSQKRIINEVRK